MRRITVAAMGVAAVLAAAGAAASIVAERPATTIARGDRVIPDLGAKLDSATRVEIAKADGSIALAKTDKGWVLPDHANYPARSEAVKTLLVSLAELETVEAKTRQPDLYGRLDLADITAKDSKAVQITVKDAGGATLAALLVGKKRYPSLGAATPGTPQDMVYVRRVGDAQSWLALGSVDAKTGVTDWADKAIVDVKFERVASVAVTPPTGPAYEINRASKDVQDFQMADVPANMVVKAPYELNGLARILEQAELDDVKAASGPLPAPAAMVKTFDGLTVSVALDKQGEVTWARLSAAGTGDAAKEADAINAKVKDWAYKLPDYKRDKLTATRDSLLQPKPQS